MSVLWPSYFTVTMDKRSGFFCCMLMKMPATKNLSSNFLRKGIEFEIHFNRHSHLYLNLTGWQLIYRKLQFITFTLRFSKYTPSSVYLQVREMDRKTDKRGHHLLNLKLIQKISGNCWLLERILLGGKKEERNRRYRGGALNLRHLCN